MWFFPLVTGWVFGFAFAAWLWYPGYKAYLQYLKWEKQIQMDLENQLNNDLVNEQFNKITN